MKELMIDALQLASMQRKRNAAKFKTESAAYKELMTEANTLQNWADKIKAGEPTPIENAIDKNKSK